MTAISDPPEAGFARRFWTYQAEHFPLIKHGVLIAVFAFAAAAYGAAAASVAVSPQAGLSAFVVLLIAFFQLHVALEPKGDATSRRPTPPAINVEELRVLAIIGGFVQVLLLGLLDIRLILLLGLAFVWMALLRADFFAPAWLAPRPAAKLLLHILIVPWLAALAFACAALSGAAVSPNAAAAFLVLAAMNGLVLALARKSWAPEQERESVETYSKLWGVERAALAVGIAALIGFLAFAGALATIKAAMAVPILLVGLALAALAGALVRYVMQQVAPNAVLMERLAAVYVLANSLALGAAAL